MPFNLGWAETLILLAVGVLLFGKNLPFITRKLGKGISEVVQQTDDLKREVRDHADEIGREAVSLRSSSAGAEAQPDDDAGRDAH